MRVRGAAFCFHLDIRSRALSPVATERRRNAPKRGAAGATSATMEGLFPTLGRPAFAEPSVAGFATDAWPYLVIKSYKPNATPLGTT